MSTQLQGIAKTKVIALTSTALPVGFFYANMAGTWTSTAVGSNFLLSGTNGAALNELMLDKLITGTSVTIKQNPDPPTIIPTSPLFGYVFYSGKIARVLAVMTDNKILVDADISASGSTIVAVTTQYNCPSKITLIGDITGASTVAMTTPGNAAVNITPTTEVVIGSEEGTMEPILMSSGGTISVVITY